MVVQFGSVDRLFLSRCFGGEYKGDDVNVRVMIGEKIYGGCLG